METNNSGRKRRDQLGIMNEILEITKEPTRKTNIMHGANLSFKQLNKYLNRLLETGLLEKYYNPHELYRRTEKAKNFLLYYHNLTLLSQYRKDSRT